MRTTPATQAEADARIAVLTKYGHLHRAEVSAEGTWTVQRPPRTRRRTLHHPVFALDFVAEVLHDVRRNAPDCPDDV